MEFNFDSLFDADAKLRNFNWVKAKILEYSTKPFRTFRGLLAFMGVTSRDVANLLGYVESGDKQATKVYYTLERFKNQIEADLEAILIYQPNGRNFDYKSLQWVLERNNPKEFKKQEKTQEQKNLEYKNNSGVSLLDYDKNC